MRKHFFIILILSVLFTSCVWIPKKDYVSIQKKSTYQSFEEINNPIVFSTQLSADFSLNLNKHQKSKKLLGGVFTIYDFESDTVKDYVTINNPRCYAQKLQKYITSSGSYKFGLWDKYENQYYFISPDKTEITMIDTAQVSDYESQTYDLSDVYRYKLFYKNTCSTNNPDNNIVIRFYDADTDTFGKEYYIKNDYVTSITTSGYTPPEKGGDGYVWFFTNTVSNYPGRETWGLNRINPKTEESDVAIVTFDGVEGSNTYENEYSSRKDWEHTINYYVVDSSENDLLIKRYNNLNSNPSNNYYDYFLVNKNTYSVTNLDIQKTNYIGKAAGKYWFCDDDYNFLAYDISASIKITDTTEMTFKKDKVSFYEPSFYTQDNVIYAFATKEYIGDEDPVRLVFAFDAVDYKLIKMTKITESRLFMDE